jgi:hypothetical protein
MRDTQNSKLPSVECFDTHHELSSGGSDMHHRRQPRETMSHSSKSRTRSDDGSMTSEASSSTRRGKVRSNDDIRCKEYYTSDETSSPHQQHAMEKKKHSHRRRRKPKLRNKVDSVNSNKCNFRNNNTNTSKKHSKISSNATLLSNEARKYTFGWNTTICPASKGGPTSKKQHDAPMMKRDLYFSLHCERVAIGGTTHAASLDGTCSVTPLGTSSSSSSAKTDTVARVTLINWENETVIDTMVQVPVPVTDFYDTGIKSEDVSTDSPNAQPFASVRQVVESTLKGKILIGHDVERHLMVLGLTHPWTDTRDTQNFFLHKATHTETDTDAPAFLSLERLCKEQLHRSLPPPNHAERPRHSCLANLDMYKKHRKEWEEYLMDEVRKKDVAQEQQVSTTQQQVPFRGPEKSQPVLPPKLGSGNDAVSVNALALHCTIVLSDHNALSLARVTALSSFHQVLLDAFVQIPGPIVNDFGSGIVPHDVMATNGALPFSVIRQRLEQLVHGRFVIGYKLDQSLGVLGMSCPSSQVRDIAYFRPLMYADMDGISGEPVIMERSLDELSLEVLRKPLAPVGDRSRPLAVCTLVLELYEMYQNHWEQHVCMQEQQQQQCRESLQQEGHYRHFSQEQSRNKSESSWFSWGKRQRPEDTLPLQYPHQVVPLSGPKITVPSAALSTQAFQVLYGESVPPSHFAGRDEVIYYEGSSYVEGSSMYDGSSYYEPSSRSRQEDNASHGILESVTAGSVVSSLHDDVPPAPCDAIDNDELHGSYNQKSSVWFRFGSRRTRYNSPSARVSLVALQEQSDDPLEMAAALTTVAPVAASDSLPEYGDDLPLSEEPPTSRSWFAFGRRSASPGRMAGHNSSHERPRSRSPESPLSGPTAATSVTELEEAPLTTHEVESDASVNAIEVALFSTTATQVISPLGELPDSSSMLDQHGTSYSWFGFRRSKSQKNATESSDIPLDIPQHSALVSDITGEADVILSGVEKPNTADDDWLQEVMSQSTGHGGNDDLNSIGFASLLESDAGVDESEDKKEIGKASRGQSSWFGFKRSKSQKPPRLEAVLDAVEDNETNSEALQFSPQLPELVSIDKTQSIAWTKEEYLSPTHSPQRGVSWYLDSNDHEIARKHSSSEDSLLSRSRLPTESTVPTILTEEEYDSGVAFTDEFEKGVAQSFAYLEI